MTSVVANNIIISRNAKRVLRRKEKWNASHPVEVSTRAEVLRKREEENGLLIERLREIVTEIDLFDGFCDKDEIEYYYSPARISKECTYFYGLRDPEFIRSKEIPSLKELLELAEVALTNTRAEKACNDFHDIDAHCPGYERQYRSCLRLSKQLYTISEEIYKFRRIHRSLEAGNYATYAWYMWD